MMELTSQVLNRIQNQPCTREDLWKLGEELGKSRSEVINSLIVLTTSDLILGLRKNYEVVYVLSEKGIVYVTMNFPPA